MTPKELFRTIYLGDRACKSIFIDGWRGIVKLQVDCISRIRSQSGQWEYYTKEDIDDGSLVFEGVRVFAIEPPGPTPNDCIDSVDCEEAAEFSDAQPLYRFRLSVGGGDPLSNVPGTVEVNITIVASALALEDPSKPGVLIAD